MASMESQQEPQGAEMLEDNDTDLLAGIIYPPIEFRSMQLLTPDIIDKTAQFVARNGPVFEEKIRDNEKGNPKFCFMNPLDPYHKYYEFKVECVKLGKSSKMFFN